MKTRAYKVLVVTIVLVYSSLFLYGVGTYSKNPVQNAKDSQMITITQVELQRGDTWIPFALPGYLDVNQEETIRFPLDYTFGNNTAPSLMMQANHSFMDFSIADHRIYHVADQPRSVGNYITDVPLPAQPDGAYLTIHIRVPERGLHRIQLPELYIADEAVYLKNQLRSDLPALILNSLLFLVGLSMLLLSLVNRKSIHFQKMMLQGITALNLSVYFMCETYSVLLLFPYSKIIYYLDMLTFSMVGTCFVLIFAWELSTKYKKVLYTVAWLGIINTLLQLILGLTGFIELRLTLRYTHILQAVAAVITIGCLIDEYRRTRNTKTIFCFSVIIIGGLMDMLLFTAERNQYHNVFFLNLGILVYMAQQSYLYLERFIEQIESITRENYYKNLAFQDVLTGCYSRLAYEIDKSKCPKSEVWTAFSFDINDLKKMNDLHGHAEGDRLLHTFGTLLILVFGNYGKCYRIGGDEFVVFCRNLSDPDCEELLLRLTKETAHLNGIQSQKLPISYAVGTYSTKDTKGDFEKAIFLSDEQMYENKKQIKSGNPGILP